LNRGWRKPITDEDAELECEIKHLGLDHTEVRSKLDRARDDRRCSVEARRRDVNARRGRGRPRAGWASGRACDQDWQAASART
jgi:hypothetical protein